MTDFMYMARDFMIWTVTVICVFLGVLLAAGWESSMNDTSGMTLGFLVACVVAWMVGVFALTEGC